MKVTVNDAPQSRKELEVEIAIERYNTAIEAEYKKVAQKVKVPGFRAGKAPRDIVERTHGHAIRATALENLINDVVREAITAQGIMPLSQPEVRDVKYEDDKSPITLKVLVEVYPTVNITKFDGFDFTKEVTIVTDEDVDAVLENIRERMAAFEPVEGDDITAAMGDMAVIDFVGSVDGVPFPGGAAEKYPLNLGSGQFIEGFEPAIVGMKLGEKKDITVTFPENYGEKSLAGKESVFAITLHEIKRKSLPEINDEFAKDVDESVATMAELRTKLTADLTEEADGIAKDRLFSDIVTKLVEANPFEVPATLIREQAGKLAQQMLSQYYMMGINPEQMGISMDQLIDQHKNTAEIQVKGAIVVNALAETQKIYPTDEEVAAKIAEQAEKAGKSVEDFRKDLEKSRRLDAVRNVVFTDKVFAFLADKNTISEERMTRTEREAKMKDKAASAAE